MSKSALTLLIGVVLGYRGMSLLTHVVYILIILSMLAAHILWR